MIINDTPRTNWAIADSELRVRSGSGSGRNGSGCGSWGWSGRRRGSRSVKRRRGRRNETVVDRRESNLRVCNVKKNFVRTHKN